MPRTAIRVPVVEQLPSIEDCLPLNRYRVGMQGPTVKPKRRFLRRNLHPAFDLCLFYAELQGNATVSFFAAEMELL